MRLIVALLAPLFLTTAPAQAADFRLATIFGDHMVLQAGQPVRVWGWDKPGTQVSLSLAGKEASGKAGKDGLWKIELPALGAGGPFELRAKGSTELTVNDVLIGEVWLGSGQSNMEYTLNRTHDAAKQVPAANFPKIRLYSVERVAAGKVQAEVKGNWKVCTPENAGGFSAVAYHFGKNLHAALKTPVGLIASSWGGTPGEDWVPRSVLDADPAFTPLMKEWDKDPAHFAAWTSGLPYDLKVSSLRLLPKDPQAKPLVLSFIPANFSNTQKADSSGAVEARGAGAHYYGKVMGGSYGSATLTLKQGAPMDLSAYEQVELKASGTGKMALSLGQPSITDYDYPSSKDFTLSKAEQTFTFPIASFKQGGWGQAKPLTQDKITTLSFNLRSPFWPEFGSACYNGMLAPVTGLALKGVLWYQGESNSGRSKEYQHLLTRLVQSWRQAFASPKLAFLTVQLPLYQKPCDAPCESDWANLRESQRLAMASLSDTELCTTLDLGEADDIHPKNKTDVGKRLADLALQLVYGSKTDAAGPRLSSLAAEGSALKATFVRGAQGMKSKGGALVGFEVAGADGKFQRAKATIKGMTVSASASGVSTPKRLRYAWADNPSGNLWGKNGLPATPFEAELP